MLPLKCILVVGPVLSESTAPISCLIYANNLKPPSRELASLKIYDSDIPIMVFNFFNFLYLSAQPPDSYFQAAFKRYFVFKLVLDLWLTKSPVFVLHESQRL